MFVRFVPFKVLDHQYHAIFHWPHLKSIQWFTFDSQGGRARTCPDSTKKSPSYFSIKQTIPLTWNKKNKQFYLRKFRNTTNFHNIFTILVFLVEMDLKIDIFYFYLHNINATKLFYAYKCHQTMSLTQYNCHQTLPFSFYLFKFLSFHFNLATWYSNFTQN